MTVVSVELGGVNGTQCVYLCHTGLTIAAATGAMLADLMACAGHSTSAAATVTSHRQGAERLRGSQGDPAEGAAS